MSTPLAVAAVTAVLKDILNNGIIAADLSALVGTVKISARSPDQVPTGGAGAPQEEPALNLFLFNVGQNSGWRNAGLPSRDDRGARLTNPPLALDLHYMLTAYGALDFQAEILLGWAMQLLQESSVVPRDAIRTALSSPHLNPPFDLLGTSGLADQIELLKIVPQTMNNEELSKLWAAFQAHYRPTAVYQVSVVLIEGTKPARSPLPVLTIGPVDPLTQRESGIVSGASLVPSYPTLQELRFASSPFSVRIGETMNAVGHHLSGVTTARFTHVRSSRTLDLAPAAGGSATNLPVAIPDYPAPPGPPDSPLDPDSWEIGQYALTAIAQNGTKVQYSNDLPLLLAPKLTPVPPVVVGPDDLTITVNVAPKAWNGQEITLVVGDLELAAQPFVAEKTDTLVFKAPKNVIPSGAQKLRLRIDGAESLVVKIGGPAPVFDATQEMTFP